MSIWITFQMLFLQTILICNKYFEKIIFKVFSIEEGVCMLNSSDINKLLPYIKEGTVINLEVKRYQYKREILLEYEDGRKLVGNLDAPNFKMHELKGLTSIVSYFARGKYGSNQWRGNCSGLLIKDLPPYYKPDTLGDLAVGSGTSIEVAYDLGYTRANTVFSDLSPKYGGVDLSSNDFDFPLMDFIFFHPPYYVFPGSSMPVYSGKQNGGMWGDEINPNDGSRITDPLKFKKWFDTCNAHLFNLLHKGGRLAILMGDSKYKQQYYSMFKNMNIFGTLEQVIIKQQHNCLSNLKKYSNNFIPISHEYLVIIRKDSPNIVPITTVNFIEKDIRKSTKITWATLISMILEEHNGEIETKKLIKLMKQHPKGQNNHNCDAKLRQELQSHPNMFRRIGNKICACL